MTYTAFRKAGKVACIQKVNDDGSTTSIPLDSANMDYQEFIKWLKDNPNDPIDLSDQPYTTPQDDLDQLAARLDIQQQYQNAVVRLQQIISAANPTNAQVVVAIQDMATIQLRVIKALRWMI